MAHMLIVGGGLAGGTAAEALRDEGFDGDITIVAAEPHPATSRPAARRPYRLDAATLRRAAAPACSRRSAQYSGSRRIGSVSAHAARSGVSNPVRCAAASARVRGTRDTIVAGHDTSTTAALEAARTAAITAHVAVNLAESACAAIRATAASDNPRCAPSAVRTIGVSIEDKSREALRAPLPRRPRVTKPVRAPRLGRYPGCSVPARLPARVARSGPCPRAQPARRTRPSRPASCDAAAYRCGGSAGWRFPGGVRALLPV